MAEDKDRITRALHDLAATCNDAAEGYAKAAKAIHDTGLSDWLARVSDERERFAADLEKAVEQAGGAARQDLHEGGILHSGWVDLEQSLRPKDEREVLQECVAGDTGALKHYDHTLAEALPPGIRSIVESQRRTVEDNLSTLRGRANQQRSAHA